ncbi:MAG TPA: DUF882 domain-containing protein [Xanthobacteraceae bacterium]|nr:DUF882 domain-containing protein [Xanthobacteraceae bacterium]
MPVCIAQQVLSLLLAPRNGFRLALAAVALILGCDSLQNAVAEGDTRTISLHHVHTKEDLTITYKRNGRYDAEALKKINWILRDWRRNEEVATDPHLLDLVWEVQREVGAQHPVHIICGYRAPQTNAMLRRKSNGVAQHSQHTVGKAIDFFVPGVSLEELRKVGLRLQRGGIGFYPSSGSPFVHLDVGSVRHWPSISREELVRIFPDGRTVHVPSDGRPLPGYSLALADLERRGSQPSSVSLTAARNAGVLTAQRDTGNSFNPLAKLFGFGKPERDEAETTAAIAPAVKTVAAARPQPRKAAEVQVAAALPPKTAPAQLIGVNVPWPDKPSPLPMLPEQALAYAPLPGPELNARPASPPPRTVESRPLPVLAVAAPAAVPAYIPRRTSIVVRQPDGKPAIVHTRRFQTGEPFDDPWMRAAILAPNLSNYMTVSGMGGEDYRSLSTFMRKPASLVTMDFSADPTPGLIANRFSGQAVVFIATTTFSARTALLQ